MLAPPRLSGGDLPQGGAAGYEAPLLGRAGPHCQSRETARDTRAQDLALHRPLRVSLPLHLDLGANWHLSSSQPNLLILKLPDTSKLDAELGKEHLKLRVRSRGKRSFMANLLALTTLSALLES